MHAKFLRGLIDHKMAQITQYLDELTGPSAEEYENKIRAALRSILEATHNIVRKREINELS